MGSRQQLLQHVAATVMAATRQGLTHAEKGTRCAYKYDRFVCPTYPGDMSTCRECRVMCAGRVRLPPLPLHLRKHMSNVKSVLKIT